MSGDGGQSFSIERAGEAAAWAETLAAPQLRLAATMLVTVRAGEAERDMAERFAAWRKKNKPAPIPETALRRTVAQIEADRDAVEQLRLDKERRQRERREKKAQLERDQRLAEVAARADAIWAEIEQLLLRATGASHTQAEQAVIELAQALTAAGRRDEFDAALARQLAANGKCLAWRKRLSKAGLI